MDIRTAFVTDKAVPITHNLPETEGRKITKCDTFVLEIKNILKLSNVSANPFVISAEGVITVNLLKHLENMGLTANSYESGKEHNLYERVIQYAKS